MRILVFGDSIGQGLLDAELGGWANRLAVDTMAIGLQNPKDEWFDVLNASISGDCSSDLLARFDAEVKARIWKQEPIVILIAIGINDTHLSHGQPVATFEDYTSNMKRLISRASSYSDHVFVVGMNPVDDTITDPVGWDESVCYRSDRIWGFEQALRKVTREENVTFVPVFEDFKIGLEQNQKLLEDGVHPSSAGHELIYRNVKVALGSVLTPKHFS